MKAKEIHIASCVAYVLPAELEAVRRAIEATGLAEVPRFDPIGKLVLLFERESSAAVVDAIDAIRALPGVMAIHLAYQHAEPESDLQETQP
ncbi:hypothetical protein BWI17_21620 [Betaproteobacteria bacterium GR16-43]|nr:hypothetical protein BWI17_21620 [Betaproteobacteria bacterium GR16-43]